MPLIDRLFEGSVRVVDLDHEEYGEAAFLLRKKFIVLNEEVGTIRLTLFGSRQLVAEMLRELEGAGLIRGAGNGYKATPAGALLIKGSDQTM